jgi:alkylation response protein AidB-like acyl-CoA dehydrogenase
LHTIIFLSNFEKNQQTMTYHFALSEEHLSVQQAARDFAQTQLLPEVCERDIKCEFPYAQVRTMGELGFMGMMVSEQEGGSGMDALSYVLAIEEISKVDASAGVIMSVNNSLVCYGLQKYGSEWQKKTFLEPLASGKKLGAFCLSEPEAGSDATSQHTTAEFKDGKYTINGTKNWITNGGNADVYLVIAQTHPELKHKGINCFVMDKNTSGFVVGKKEDKMGIRASDTHSLMFTDVVLGEEHRVGVDGAGFKIAMTTLNGGRIGIAAQALGIAAGAYELALKYSKERKTFGKPICEHQAIQFKLADMHTRIEAARLLVYKAAWQKDQGQDYVESAAMAKLYASEVAMWATTEAVQIHGGYGYVREFHVERMMRDAKITQIYEGTSEIQKMVIGREILK